MSENNLHNDDNLNQEAPFLFGLKKEEPFQAPEGYFEKFQSQLQEKIHSNKSSWWNNFLRPIVWAPSMIVLIAAGIFFFQSDDSDKKQVVAKTNDTPELNDLSFEVLDAYVNDNLLAQVNTDDLLELVPTEDLPSLGNSSAEAEINQDIAPMIEHLEEEDMEEYILENIDEMEVF